SLLRATEPVSGRNPASEPRNCPGGHGMVPPCRRVTRAKAMRPLTIGSITSFRTQWRCPRLTFDAERRESAMRREVLKRFFGLGAQALQTISFSARHMGRFPALPQSL